MDRVSCVVLGSGNIGTDLVAKLLRSETLAPAALVGIDPRSEGLRRARDQGVATTTDGVPWIIANMSPGTIVFDATSAWAHVEHAPTLLEAGMQIIDLTPAKLGPGVVPVVNLHEHQAAPDINMISCGGQATVPIVAAVSSVVPVERAEIVATIASRSAGPGTRQNIDEFTKTTAGALVDIGGAAAGKAIIILNPAEPPINMRNTVYCSIPPGADQEMISQSIREMVARVAAYVPGYALRNEPVYDDGRVAVFLEVVGRGDFLPEYAGNLDIMTSAAVRVGEDVARLAASGEMVAR